MDSERGAKEGAFVRAAYGDFVVEREGSLTAAAEAIARLDAVGADLDAARAAARVEARLVRASLASRRKIAALRIHSPASRVPRS